MKTKSKKCVYCGVEITANDRAVPSGPNWAHDDCERDAQAAK